MSSPAATDPTAAAIRLLFVCMGNICRSPTAEGVMRAKLAAAGLDSWVSVDSAATHDYHPGEPPDRRSQRHAKARGYDLSALRARVLVPADFCRFDRVLAMDEGNLLAARRRCPPGLEARLGLLTEHCRRFAGATEVPDPYDGDAADFERVLDLVEDACDGLIAALASTLPERGGSGITRSVFATSPASTRRQSGSPDSAG
jgi:protein-tyrosine phosphatase